MKVVFSILIVFLLGSASGTFASEVDSSFHIYILAGQSNMAGRGEVSEMQNPGNPRVLMLNAENKWVTAKHPIHFDKSYAGVGPGLAFAKEMLAEEEGVTIGLVPCAWGGSPIRVWQPGESYHDHKPFDEAMARARVAMNKGVVKGILWHQGESDNDSAKSLTYLQSLEDVIQNFREELGIHDLPFIAGELGYFNKHNFINPLLTELPNRIPFTSVVSADGLRDKGDRLHFDTPSANELGRRYAERMKLFLQTDRLPKMVALTFDDAEISHLTNVASVLEGFEFDATFYVCEFPRKQPADSALYMNWSQIRELHNRGFEIGNHTGHHKNMTKLTREEMIAEVQYVEDKCAQFGIPQPVTFAYPGNRNDSLSRAVLDSLGYWSARAGGRQYYRPGVQSLYQIPSFTTGSTDALKDRAWEALRNAKAGEVVVLTIHGVPDEGHPGYSTSQEYLTEILAYIKQQDFQVIAMRDLVKFINTWGADYEN